VAKSKKLMPKQVVYLLGAGATQAEVDHLGAAQVFVLMRDSKDLGREGLSTAILRKLGAKGIPFAGTEHGVDIEKLISLLTATGVQSQTQLAERMRRLYFNEIRLRLAKAKIINRPQLALGLFEMHNNEKFKTGVESLTGILTTNHDGLLQIASERVFGGVSLGFPFTSRDLSSDSSKRVPPILQLHGSFSWQFGLPPSITSLKRDSKYRANTMWIPPTVLKESKNYPFNKISGLAYEILSRRCDVLRIIGSSLTQNDWNILCLIFNAQRHRELRHRDPLRIEFIMSRSGGEDIQGSCSYLKNTFPINHLSEGDFSGYEEDMLPADSELRNAFAYWLREKINYHRRRDEFDLPIGSCMTRIAGDTV
jgi:hypothetical protein